MRHLLSLQEMRRRNKRIVQLRREGLSISSLTERFGVSYYITRKALYNSRKQNNATL